jgi:hypothetical protein
MHYKKKYQLHSPLFAPRDPRLSAQILAAFGGDPRKPLSPPPPRRPVSESR